MNAFRFFVIILIYLAATLAWVVLGGTIEWRTRDMSLALGEEVTERWGPSGLVQRAPALSAAGGGDPARSDIEVRFDHENRYMGLVWFSTYVVDFRGTYMVAARSAGVKADEFVFDLPAGARVFENLAVSLDGQPRDLTECKDGNRLRLQVPADGREHAVTVSYRTQARDRWIYDLARGRSERPASRDADAGEPADPGQAAFVKALRLVATTNFRNIDYPRGCVSPTPHKARAEGGGMRAEWHFENRSTRERIGIEMPARENAGPIAARMSFHAPVSLFFFFTVMFTIVVLKKIPLHPMHYLFISAGFFSFHILLAYLVDHIDIHLAFWISAAVSVFMVVNYMRLVAGVKFALAYVGAAQLVYLIGFSYAFFFKGFTGLTVVVVAILTLFMLMTVTARLAWDEVFRRSAAPAALAAPDAGLPTGPTP